MRERARVRTREEENSHSLGKLKQERITVPRGEGLLNRALELLREHAPRKATLEITFVGEEGHGSGVTAEFYSLISEALQDPTLALWISEGPSGALFPAPAPQDLPAVDARLQYYGLVGILLGKALLDGRLLTLPLSEALFKLITGKVLSPPDLALIAPSRARHLSALVSAPETAADFALTFEFAPPDVGHGFTSHELVPSGSAKEVLPENVHEYVDAMTEFMLARGVARQVNAIFVGLSSVMPLSALRVLTAAELRARVVGETKVEWSLEDLQDNVEARHGYTESSPPFVLLLEVLSSLPEPRRRDFLRFSTGVGGLPCGGLRQLDPKLTVVRKVCEDPDNHYPSANTCFHFLKLPEYSSRQRLEEQLLTALNAGMDGFFFN